MNKLKYSFILSFGFLLSQPAMAQTTEKQHKEKDLATLQELNSQFIKNFIAQDTVSHNQIIHKDFVCIESSGAIVTRDQYMKDWAHDYENGGFINFYYTDEVIRIFGSMALVRSKTVYRKVKDGVTSSGNSIYTDTYVKENGRWWCVQAHITPVKLVFK